jgi:diguanylate cyclase (GGDEF)-like protein
MRLGVDDYVIKRTMNPRELIAAIVRAVENDRKEATIKAEFERLKAATSIDLITGMLARAQIDESLAALAALDAAARAQYALILAQLANLREIREKFGLKAGELALREFATRLRQGIRSHDICGRFGDDTLLVIANVNGDRIVSTRLCERLAARAAASFDTDTGSAPLSGRFGATICVPETGGGAAKPDDLVEPARKALRIATEAELSWALLPLAPAIHGGAPVRVEGDAAVAPIQPRPAAEVLRTGDRRRESRQRVFKRGQIIVPERNISMNCMVRNLSPHGAGLRIEAVFAAPESFELAIFGSADRRKVRLRWQTGVDLGVEFVDIL